MLDLHEDIFFAFRDAATHAGVYPSISHYPKIDRFYADKFEKWKDAIGIFHFDIPPDTSGGFDQIWIINLTSRAVNSRSDTSRFGLVILASESATGRIAAITTDSNKKHFDRLLADQSEISEILDKYKGIPDKIATEARPYRTSRIYALHADHGWIEKTLNGYALKAAFQAELMAGQVMRAIHLPQARRETLSILAREATTDILNLRLTEGVDAFQKMIDQQSLRAAKDFCATYKDADGHGSIGIYNHIVRANSPRERETRIGTLPMVGRSGSLFLHETQMWNNIDSGASFYTAMGEAFGTSPGTIKHMLRAPELFALGTKKFPETARWLDILSIQRWPANAEELAHFNTMCDLAQIYANAFSRDPYQTLAQWTRESGPKCRWKHMAFSKLKKTMRAMSAGEVAQALSLPPRAIANPDLPEQLAHRAAMTPRRLIHNPRLWPFGVKKYAQALKDINDMKTDVHRRLVKAAIYSTFETQGFKVTDNAPLAELEHEAQSRLWKNCPPHEQIEASAYWHSPNVNFGMRLQSITQTEGMTWHTLVSGAVRLDNGVVAHPLASNDALREEGDAMAHCVWSYGYNCLKHGHHIFSLRNAQGVRLSTLDLIEKRDANGITFHIGQNNSVSNTTPTSQAIEAGNLLVEYLKKADIDWAPIERDRAEFSAREIDTAVGYDFRDPEQSQKVFDLYRPCLPRKVLRQSGGSLAGLAKQLGLDGLVQSCLASNPAKAGLLSLQPSARTPRPAP